MQTELASLPPRAMTKRRPKVNQEAVWGFVFISPWLVGFLIFTLGPVVASLVLSLTRYELITPPQWVGIDNYVTLMAEDRLFRFSLYNSAYYTLFSVLLGVAVAFGLAVLLNQKLPGMRIYRTAFYLPVVTSGVAVALLWVWLFNAQFGLINFLLRSIGLRGPGWLVDPKWAKPAFILMSLWGTGGTAIIFLAGLQGVPRSLYEAAAIDGANAWRRFWHVTVPMMSPVIFFNVVMGTIGSFQVFTQAYVMTEGGPQNATLFYVLYLFKQGFRLFRMGYAAAMAWILFVIILSLTLVQLRLARRWVYYEGELRG